MVILLRAVGILVSPGVAACVGDDIQSARWTAEPTVRAGELDGPAALAEVFDVEVGPANQILVAPPMVRTIAVFDSTGRFQRVVGRAGQGPGEFRSLGKIGWTGDTLWAIDFGRVHLYDSSLRFVRTITPVISKLPEGLEAVIPGPLMADGSIIGIPISYGSTVESEPVALLTQTGSVTRILADIPTAGRLTELRFKTGPPEQPPNPWADSPLWRNAADGRSLVVINRTLPTRSGDAVFTVLRIGLGGDTLIRKSIAYAPVALDRAVRDRAYRLFANQFASSRSRTVSDIEAEWVLGHWLTPRRT